MRERNQNISVRHRNNPLWRVYILEGYGKLHIIPEDVTLTGKLHEGHQRCHHFTAEYVRLSVDRRGRMRGRHLPPLLYSTPVLQGKSAGLAAQLNHYKANFHTVLITVARLQRH